MLASCFFLHGVGIDDATVASEWIVGAGHVVLITASGNNFRYTWMRTQWLRFVDLIASNYIAISIA